MFQNRNLMIPIRRVKAPWSKRRKMRSERWLGKLPWIRRVVNHLAGRGVNEDVVARIKSHQEAVARETQKVAEERARKNPETDFAAQPGGTPAQETERQRDLVDAVAKKLAAAKAEQAAQESAPGVPAFNNLGQQPWPPVQASLAKVAARGC